MPIYNYYELPATVGPRPCHGRAMGSTLQPAARAMIATGSKLHPVAYPQVLGGYLWAGTLPTLPAHWQQKRDHGPRPSWRSGRAGSG
jgi:hypothetical protein